MPTVPPQDVLASPLSGRLERMAAIGIPLFAFSAPFSVSLAYAGLALFALAFIAEGVRLRALLREPVVIAALVFAGYVAGHSLLWYLQAPTAGYAHSVARTGGDWIKLLFFIPFAYWVERRPQHIAPLLLLFVLGLAFGFLRKVDWSALDLSFFTTQFWGYLPPLALGMFSALGVIGLLVCRASLVAVARRGGRWWLVIPAYAALLALMLEMLMLSFSRSSWLSLVVCLSLWGLLAAGRALRARDAAQLRRGLWTVLIVVALLATAIGLNRETLLARFASEDATLGQIAAGRVTEDNRSSLALRLHAWRFGYALWSERPWFGWGAGTSGYWIEHSGLPQLKDGDLWLSDLHNTYLELLFQLGLVGLALFLALVWLLVRDTARGCRGAGGPAPPRDWAGPAPCLCDLLLLVGVFAALWVLTDHRATNHDWRFFWILVAGSGYALHLARRPPARPLTGDSGQ